MPKDKKTWKEYAWPEWVPQELRDQIESFWGENAHRYVDDWEKDAAYAEKHYHAPKLGTYGLYGAMYRETLPIWGKYVHAWNNIARVVDNDGNVHVIGASSPMTNEHVKNLIVDAVKRQNLFLEKQSKLSSRLAKTSQYIADLIAISKDLEK